VDGLHVLQGLEDHTAIIKGPYAGRHFSIEGETEGAVARVFETIAMKCLLSLFQGMIRKKKRRKTIKIKLKME
jgi:hypothetical protein